MLQPPPSNLFIHIYVYIYINSDLQMDFVPFKISASTHTGLCVLIHFQLQGHSYTGLCVGKKKKADTATSTNKRNICQIHAMYH